MRFADNSDVDVVAGEIRSEVFDRVQFLKTRTLKTCSYGATVLGLRQLASVVAAANSRGMNWGAATDSRTSHYCWLLWPR
jgi:hypothetical protein